jgi:hypothetical protein
MGGGIEAAQRKLAGKVMGKPGVVGTAIGERRGKPCVQVYVSDAAAARTIPSSVDGFPVVVTNSGRIERL